MSALSQSKSQTEDDYSSSHCSSEEQMLNDGDRYTLWPPITDSKQKKMSRSTKEQMLYDEDYYTWWHPITDSKQMNMSRSSEEQMLYDEDYYTWWHPITDSKQMNMSRSTKEPRLTNEDLKNIMAIILTVAAKMKMKGEVKESEKIEPKQTEQMQIKLKEGKALARNVGKGLSATVLCVTVGGVFGGPAGIFVGGAIGGLVGYLMTRGKFKLIHQILDDLPTEQKRELCLYIWRELQEEAALKQYKGCGLIVENGIRTFFSNNLNIKLQ